MHINLSSAKTLKTKWQQLMCLTKKSSGISSLGSSTMWGLLFNSNTQFGSRLRTLAVILFLILFQQPTVIRTNLSSMKTLKIRGNN